MEPIAKPHKWVETIDDERNPAPPEMYKTLEIMV